MSYALASEQGVSSSCSPCGVVPGNRRVLGQDTIWRRNRANARRRRSESQFAQSSCAGRLCRSSFVFTLVVCVKSVMFSPSRCLCLPGGSQRSGCREQLPQSKKAADRPGRLRRTTDRGKTWLHRSCWKSKVSTLELRAVVTMSGLVRNSATEMRLEF